MHFHFSSSETVLGSREGGKKFLFSTVLSVQKQSRSFTLSLAQGSCEITVIPSRAKKRGGGAHCLVPLFCLCVCLHGWCPWLHCTVVCMKLLPVHRCQQPRSTDQNRQCVATRGLCVPRAETEDRLNTKNLPVLSLLRRSARVSPEHAIFKTGGGGLLPFFPLPKSPARTRIEEYGTGLRLSLLSTCLLLLRGGRWGGHDT